MYTQWVQSMSGPASSDLPAVEFVVPEVEPSGKTAPTRADLADVTPVPCARLDIQEGVASAGKLGCQAGDPVRPECEGSSALLRCGGSVAQSGQ